MSRAHLRRLLPFLSRLRPLLRWCFPLLPPLLRLRPPLLLPLRAFLPLRPARVALPALQPVRGAQDRQHGLQPLRPLLHPPRGLQLPHQRQPRRLGEAPGQLLLREHRLQLRLVLVQPLRQLEDLLLLAPDGMPAPPPVGEVLGVDRLAAEVRGQHGLHGRLGIEPRQQLRAGVALLKPDVEGVAHGARKTGDFSKTGHGSM
ncbi:MAG: hypothetical protein NTV51_12730 [Verrucomicrobia bacterium]|nr:hypothetical protein [Verrucomicrobiota bacterium]